MNQISKVFLACACSLSGLTTQAQDQTVWSNDFSNASQPLNTVGRGVCRVNDGVFHSRSAYALFGNPEWKDYTLSFKARAPKDAEQVQIWAGFRTHNRFDRYVIGIKGGLQDDLYLMRTGYMGTDEFMGGSSLSTIFMSTTIFAPSSREIMVAVVPPHRIFFP